MKILDLLKQLEWSCREKEDFGHGDMSWVKACPSCGITLVKVMDLEYGSHKPDCDLAKAIRELEGEPGEGMIGKYKVKYKFADGKYWADISWVGTTGTGEDVRVGAGIWVGQIFDTLEECVDKARKEIYRYYDVEEDYSDVAKMGADRCQCGHHMEAHQFIKESVHACGVCDDCFTYREKEMEYSDSEQGMTLETKGDRISTLRRGPFDHPSGIITGHTEYFNLPDSNKPSWDQAPEWANWLAKDEDGEWWWFEKKPEYDKALGQWWTEVGGKTVAVMGYGAKNSLEERP